MTQKSVPRLDEINQWEHEILRQQPGLRFDGDLAHLAGEMPEGPIQPGGADARKAWKGQVTAEFPNGTTRTVRPEEGDPEQFRHCGGPATSGYESPRCIGLADHRNMCSQT